MVGQGRHGRVLGIFHPKQTTEIRWQLNRVLVRIWVGEQHSRPMTEMETGCAEFEHHIWIPGTHLSQEGIRLGQVRIHIAAKLWMIRTITSEKELAVPAILDHFA